jgi:hypothetical protein
MKVMQSSESKINNEKRVSILVDEIMNLTKTDPFNSQVYDIMKLTETYIFTSTAFEKYITIFQTESVEKKTSDKVVCDILKDTKVFQIFTALIYYRFLQDLFDVINNIKAYRKVEELEAQFKNYIKERYDYEDSTLFHVDYARLCIMDGPSYEELQFQEKNLQDAKTILENDISLGFFQEDFMNILDGPDREEVKSTCEKLFHMEEKDLKKFTRTEKRKPIRYIAQMLYNQKVRMNTDTNEHG